jgi:hypothetical protein
MRRKAGSKDGKAKQVSIGNQGQSRKLDTESLSGRANQLAVHISGLLT